MKNRITTLGLMVAALFSACTADFDNNEQINPTHYSTLNLGIDNTRVGVEEQDAENYSLYWQTGDVVAVNGVASQPIAEAYNGATSAQINVEGEIVYPAQILFPASVYAAENTINIPTEQAYLQDALANGYGIMLGYAESEDAPVTMKHACGYIHISLTGNSIIKKVALLATRYEYLSGTFTTTCDAEGVSLVAPATAATPHISITSAEGIQLSSTPTDLFFAVPAGRYEEGFTLRVIDDTNNVMIKYAYGTAGKTIVAGQVIDMPTISYTADTQNGINNEQDWIDMAHGTNPSAWADGENIVYVNKDLNMSGRSVPAVTISGGEYVIDGCNHKITNLNATKEGEGSHGLLFDYIANGCGVENLTLGASAGAFNKAFTTEPDSKLTTTVSGVVYVSPFCVALAGYVKNCTNNAGVEITPADAVNIRLFAGGLAAVGHRVYKNTYGPSGDVINSTNNGHIYIAENANTTQINNLQVGGIYGRAIDNTITGCTNNGVVYVSLSPTSNGFAKASDKQCIAVGGIVGNVPLHEPEGETPSTESSATISNNTNTATVTLTSDTVLGDSPVVGGIVGVTAASISNCHNTARLEVVATNANTPIIGGVVGECDVEGVTLSELTNNGIICITSTNTNAQGFIGGIAGKAYLSDSSKSTNVITGCTNNGKVAVMAAARYFMGGICGGAPNVTGCTNNGELATAGSSIKVATQSGIGGIAGNLAGDLTNNNSFGKVYIYGSGKNIRIGGLAGRCVCANLAIDNCAVSATVGNSRTDGAVGMLLGLTNQAMSVGATTACYVYGNHIVGSTTTTLAADNYTSYLVGSGANLLTTTNVKFENKK